MKEFRVIKDHGIFEKGDLFVKEGYDTYVSTASENDGTFSYSSKLSVSGRYIADAIENGAVVEVKPKVTTVENKVTTELAKLTKEYNEDLNNTFDRYQRGEISEIQKAEAVTVLSNLIKLTNHINSLYKA